MPRCLLAFVIVVGLGTAAWGQPRGADLRVDLNLTFAEAVWGTTKDVKVTRDVACSTCGGNGARSGMRGETSTLSVTVPAGVDEGQSLRLAGKGEAAPGGTTGNLYVVLHVQRDERFKRNGEDVLRIGSEYSVQLLERRAIDYRNNAGYNLTIDNLAEGRAYRVQRYRISASNDLSLLDSTEQRGPSIRLHAQLPPPGIELIVLQKP